MKSAQQMVHLVNRFKSVERQECAKLYSSNDRFNVSERPLAVGCMHPVQSSVT